LAFAVQATVDAGAKVINLSVGIGNSSVEPHPALNDSMDYAFKKGVLVVAASGNSGRIGHIPLFNHPWVIPVAACDQQGKIMTKSNLGPSLGKRGLMAPGLDVISIVPPSGHTTMSGTSVAAPFVTGMIALLWSLFPQASAEQIRSAVLLPQVERRSIVPPLLNADASWRYLGVKVSAHTSH
jgi:subtilisin family serine protease